MKKKLLFGLVLLLSMTVQAQTDRLLKINGEVVEKVPVTITLDYQEAGNVIVEFTDSTKVSCSMNRLEILPNESNDIRKVGSTDEGFFVIKGAVRDELRIEGAEPGADVMIFSAGGTLLKKDKTSSSLYVTDVSRLQHGVYLLRIGKRAVKFIKQ
jgi:hypothetical protein